MGMIEQQAVIECLTNTANYYEREDADEWTKGIHYGLLHGLDNILDNVPAVEAIPIAYYETRLKADMVTMLEEIREKLIGEMIIYGEHGEHDIENGIGIAEELIQQKIDKLKENDNDK